MADKKKKKQNIPDQLQTWKPPYFKWLLVLIGCGYVGLLLGCNYRKGDTVYELFPRIGARIGTGDLLNIGLADGLHQLLFLPESYTSRSEAAFLYHPHSLYRAHIPAQNPYLFYPSETVPHA